LLPIQSIKTNSIANPRKPYLILEIARNIPKTNKKPQRQPLSAIKELYRSKLKPVKFKTSASLILKKDPDLQK